MSERERERERERESVRELPSALARSPPPEYLLF